ncbi:MAG: tryptophan synthase subunit alpha [Betaproteobacteria bacterium]|nr:tryptophan synthase subunit alpha [Betaproteobacteria bacterium]
MSRIQETFARLQNQQRKALIPFITAGDPSADLTVPLMHTLVKAGSDLIELGMPFSDPMAEGPVIQRACERALKNGVGLKQVLAMVSAFREQDQTTPVVLMGYANPIEHMGVATFAERARAAGVDGVLVVDYPPEEGADFLSIMDAAGLDTIYLLSPTSSTERIKRVADCARGYVYYVSLKGVTGAAHIDTQEVEAMLSRIKQHIHIPVGVGFGIRDGETAKRIAGFADAVVIGSRIIQEIEASPTDKILENVGFFLSSIRQAMDTRAPL